MSGLRRGAILAVLALLAVAPSAPAAIPAPPSAWYGLPGLNAASGAQWARSFAYSTPPNVVYAGLEGGGVFRSVNGGATWSAFNAGFPNPLTTNVRALLTSGTGTEVLAGTDTGVWKSSGGGAWQPLGQGAGPGKLNGSVQALISLPGNTLLAAVASGGVWKSTDGGASWTAPAAGNGMPSSETPYGFVAQPPLVPLFVLAATHDGIFRSTDGGSTWSLASDGIPSSASPIQAWVDTSQPNLMYASTASNGIYRSINAGLTWSAINDGLGAVRARGFQIFTAAEGAHLYAATEDGLWEALQTHDVVPPAPRWRAVTQEGLIEPGASNTIMWALTAPAIPGSGALGLIAGTQSNGGYFLSFEPPDNTCPSANTTNTASPCPQISDTTPTEAQSLTGVRGRWTGTALIGYAYQWQACSGTTDGSCRDIPGAEETTFVVPEGSTSRYRLKVTATNPAPTFRTVFRTSAITSVTAANPGRYPGSTQQSAPGISVNAPGETTSPQVGDTMHAEYGIAPSAFSDGWFNPKATTTTYQWLRCDGSGGDCDEIAGATRRDYALTPADGTHDLRVRVTGTNASGTLALTSGPSYDVTSLPAAVGDPIPDPDGGAPKPQTPALAGSAWVGQTLAGTVGGWQDPTTEFSRRWVRCDASGGACTSIQRVGSTDPETGSTYVVRAGDLGYTLRMRVTADVNGDVSDNRIDDHLPHAVEVDTAPSAVVTAPPGGGGDGAAGGGGGGSNDTTKPVVTRLAVTHKRFAVSPRATAISARKRRRAAVPKGTAFTFRLSEQATVLIAIDQLAPGRKAGGRCRRPTRANRRGAACRRAIRAGTLTRRGLGPGRAAVAFSGRIGRHKLAPGSYRATVVASDAAGNASRGATVAFAVVRG